MQDQSTPRTLLKGASKLPTGSLSSGDGIPGNADTKDAIKGFLTAADRPPIGPPPMGGGFNYSMQQAGPKPLQNVAPIPANQPKIFNPAAMVTTSVESAPAIVSTAEPKPIPSPKDIKPAFFSVPNEGSIASTNGSIGATQGGPQTTSIALPVVTGAPIPANASSASSGPTNSDPNPVGSAPVQSSTSSRSHRKQTSGKKIEVPYDQVLSALAASPAAATLEPAAGKSFFPDVAGDNDEINHSMDAYDYQATTSGGRVSRPGTGSGINPQSLARHSQKATPGVTVEANTMPRSSSSSSSNSSASVAVGNIPNAYPHPVADARNTSDMNQQASTDAKAKPLLQEAVPTQTGQTSSSRPGASNAGPAGSSGTSGTVGATTASTSNITIASYSSPAGKANSTAAAVVGNGKKAPMVAAPKGTKRNKISRHVTRVVSSFEKYLIYVNIFLSFGIFATLIAVGVVVMVVLYDIPLEQLAQDFMMQVKEIMAICVEHSPVSKQQIIESMQQGWRYAESHSRRLFQQLAQVIAKR